MSYSTMAKESDDYKETQDRLPSTELMQEMDREKQRKWEGERDRKKEMKETRMNAR